MHGNREPDNDDIVEYSTREVRNTLVAHHVLERQLREHISYLESALRRVGSIAERALSEPADTKSLVDICTVIEGAVLLEKRNDADPS